jgi:hypothetical protein
MQQIADWLEKLGPWHYAQRFADNGIDVSALRHLTDRDLKDIGVSLGKGRKILAAINAAPKTALSRWQVNRRATGLYSAEWFLGCTVS